MRALLLLLLVGCTDPEPAPQLYLCTVSDAHTGVPLFQVERCSLEDPALDISRALRTIPRVTTVSCEAVGPCEEPYAPR